MRFNFFSRWFAIGVIAAALVMTGCSKDGEQGPVGPQGEKGIQGPKGEKGDKGDKGDQGIQGVPGNANVKMTQWTAFDHESEWANLGTTAARFTDSYDLASKPTLWNELKADEYAVLCYVRHETDDIYFFRYLCPVVFKDHNEFGNGLKQFQFDWWLHGISKKMLCRIIVQNLEGQAVTAYRGNWQYKLVFIKTSGSMFGRPADKGALLEELKGLSYEEMCRRYNITE
ncbi:collagen-like triple helix repeat-containing protein [Capnocytophaga canimorsus]|uniref:collagen-like triple helix repeat-containing protein n=2 Tax=Capnocytophaga canimorsus TaxID=28188 RepID=UPI001F512CF0|nr:collagen-like protein [Capnocytophaga canimorsus]